VKAAGVVVGRVEAVRLDPKSYDAVVTLRIDRDYQFSKDTIAAINTSGLLGEVYIGLDAGGDTVMLNDGDRIKKTQSAVVIVKLIAQAYVANVPELIRTGVSNFFGNIDDLFTGINNVLEGRGDQAGDDFGRVLLNSTMGVGGIFDLASMMGINKDKKDFGITFGKWGAPQGPYFFVPLFGPTTLRDGTGTAVR